MPQVTQIEDNEEDFIDSITDSDYIFVVSSDGQLKSVLLPQEFEADPAPDSVQKILTVFGITGFENQTIH
jgi:hypothetical protein